MKSLEDDLLDDINSKKIKDLEYELEVTRRLLEEAIDSLKDTQRYLVKLAHNQSEITKRIAQWPYLVVYPDDNYGNL